VGETGNAHKVLIDYLDRRVFGRPRYGWIYEIAVDLKIVDFVPLAWYNGLEA
jgi:hypothetical protein